MVLPICKDVCLKTLNCFAMPLSILQTSENFSYNYMFYKTVNIYSKKKNILLMNENSLIVPRCLPFPFWLALNFRVKLFHNKSNIKKIIIKSLNKKRYVYICLNEQYIPHREAFGKFYCYHELLIYGYDKTDDNFYTIGFDENHRYTPQKIKSTNIMNAYNTTKLNRISFFNIWTRKNFNFSKLRNQLVKIKLFFYFHPCKQNYGWKAYDYFCNQLTKDFSEGKIDIRSFRTILDRANIIANTSIVIHKLPQEYNDLIIENVRIAEVLMNLVLKYSITYDKKLECQIVSKFKKYAYNEKELFKFIMSIL